MRTPEEAIEWAKSRDTWTPSGMCLQFTRTAYGLGSYYGSASEAWNKAELRHKTSNANDIPRGAPVFWIGGSRGFGHIAVSLGDGLCISTDWPSRNRVGTARIDDISKSWGQQLVGWTEDLNRSVVWTNPGPVVDLSDIEAAIRNKTRVRYGRLIKRAVAKEVGKGDMVLSHGVLGDGFVTQYRELQKKFLETHGREINDDSADGIPGSESLGWLGRRHGFNVKS